MPTGRIGFLAELRRRKVLRVAAFYVIAAWVVVQVASEVFPAINLPESTIRYVWLAVILGFPVAIVFGWRFDVVGGRIVRTSSEDAAQGTDRSLERGDYFILVALIVFAGSIVFGLTRQIIVTPAEETVRPEINASARSVAVLPFENISKDEKNAPFTDGIHDDLLTQLARISTLKVISRTSVQRYRGTTKTAPQIAAELGVATILEGGVQRSGNLVRINVQLIDARSDEHLWAETYDRDLTARNVYAIQTEIAENITLALDSALTEEDRAKLDKVPTEDLEAYYAYLLGRQRMVNRNSVSLQQAAEFFQKAVELDPDYALAYVGLANTYILLGDYGNLSLNEMLANALPAINTAMRLDGKLAEAHATMGVIRARTSNYAAAEASFERALSLDSNYATAYHWYGDVLVNFLARPQDAVPLLQRALELDPLSPQLILTLGQALDGLGRFDDAMSLYMKTMEIEPSYASSYLVVGGVHRYAYGRLDEGIRWRFKGMAQDPGNILGLSGTGMCFLDLGDDAEAEYWISRAVTLAPDQFAPNRALAYLYRFRNDEERALAAARKLMAITPGNNASLVTLISFGRYTEAFEEFAPLYPELLCDDGPTVTRSNLFQALNLSLALEKTGDRECATTLLNRVLVQLPTIPRMGFFGYGFADVEILARLGKEEQAIASLRRAIDDNYRAYWWSQVEKSPHTVSLRENPEFIAMMREIKEDMALQLARVREMRLNAELPTIPVPQP
jgi:TolB-like protein/cytochrome c-type biogenesis protein CcmH/NrfG